ncbi:MBL fold metallo-hydrolase [Cetobacterium somerae]|uniref:MBL fold metallo-hydrolase n=1 Tax=Cetobacterium somerae TaxID=188913 RepID=UPI00224DA97A|nr:MBL fold metallo-hydrolase [Cetobacterium somerae]MCX3066978.1 MBL fold metallo-hydrolase [Cetobacterium somerae]
MKTIFLGTGSANGLPDVFCSCEYCNSLRKLKGKNIRKRSTFLLGDKILLDFSPDIRTQILENGIDFSKIKDVLLSHTHNDHLDIQELIKIKNPMNIYVNSSSEVWLKEQIKTAIKPKHQKNLQEKIGHLNIIPMSYYTPFTIEDFEIIPIEAKHTGLNGDEQGTNFIIKHANFTRLHASDTGIYSLETFEFLKNFKFDDIVIECTFLDFQKDNSDHLDIFTLNMVLNRLKDFNCIDSNTPITVTHFGHDPKKTHEEIEKLMKSLNFNISVAYDGLSINNTN